MGLGIQGYLGQTPAPVPALDHVSHTIGPSPRGWSHRSRSCSGREVQALMLQE